MGTKTVRSRSALEKEYKKTVLKVPDCFAVSKGCVTHEMLRTKHELFEVDAILYEFNFTSFSALY